MALSTEKYGYLIDPMLAFTDEHGNTIKNGFLRIFLACTSTPAVTFDNFDGTPNEEKIQIDNSGRTATSVIADKSRLYKVCVYDSEHSQETPIVTKDNVAVGDGGSGEGSVTYINYGDSTEADIRALVDGGSVVILETEEKMVPLYSTASDGVVFRTNELTGEDNEAIEIIDFKVSGSTWTRETKTLDPTALVAEYGATTATEIQDALNDGRVVYAVVNGSVAQLWKIDTGKYTFRTTHTRTVESDTVMDLVDYVVNNTTWSTETRTISGGSGQSAFLSKVMSSVAFDTTGLSGAQDVISVNDVPADGVYQVSVMLSVTPKTASPTKSDLVFGFYGSDGTGMPNTTFHAVVDDSQTFAQQLSFSTTLNLKAGTNTLKLVCGGFATQYLVFVDDLSVAQIVSGVYHNGDEFSEVHTLTEALDFNNDDGVLVDGATGGPRFMSKGTLLKETAQNALAGNVAPAFDPTRTSENPYKAGESVAYEGKSYTFKVDHYGAWASRDVYPFANKFIQTIVDEKKISGTCGKNLFNKNTVNSVTGLYVGYNSGIAISSSSQFSAVIYVGEGVELAFNKDYLNVSAFSGEIVLPYEPIDGRAIHGYIGGIATDSSHRTWTTPAGCKCIVVSVSSSNISTLQVEIGSVPTEYEEYKLGISQGDVFGLVGDLGKKLDGAVGKNLFNKNTENKTANNLYVIDASGYVAASSNYKGYVVEVEAGTVLSFNKQYIHVVAFNKIPDLTAVSSGDVIPGRVGGFNGEAKQGWTVPNGAVCIVVSCSNSNADSLQVEIGSSSTAYTPWIFGLPLEKVIGAENLSAMTYFVGSGMQYETIQSAVNAVPDKSTIVVMPGTYNESVDVRTSGKMLRIVGFNRDKCVITHDIADYAEPPMEIGKGVIENITFLVTGTTLQNLGAYCVHVDYDSEENSALQFINCIFKNTLRPCIGIGLRSNFTLSFVGCRFECYSSYGPIYCHEQQASNKEGQRIEFTDCSLLNTLTTSVKPVISLMENTSFTGNSAEILMQRNILKSKAGAYGTVGAVQCLDYSGDTPTPPSGGGKYLDSYMWSLDYMSEMNSEAIANYNEQ